jgi:hypothetical protein
MVLLSTTRTPKESILPICPAGMDSESTRVFPEATGGTAHGQTRETFRAPWRGWHNHDALQRRVEPQRDGATIRNKHLAAEHLAAKIRTDERFAPASQAAKTRFLATHSFGTTQAAS